MLQLHLSGQPHLSLHHAQTAARSALLSDCDHSAVQGTWTGAQTVAALFVGRCCHLAVERTPAAVNLLVAPAALQQQPAPPEQQSAMRSLICRQPLTLTGTTYAPVTTPGRQQAYGLEAPDLAPAPEPGQAPGLETPDLAFHPSRQQESGVQLLVHR